MTHYFALIHKDKDSAYGVTFPDLPGCYSAADTADDILANAMEALKFFVEDMGQVPAPTPIESIRQQKDVAEELAQGAYLVAVPLLRNTGKTTRINITLDKGLLEAIDVAARTRKMTRSGFLAQAAVKEVAG